MCTADSKLPGGLGRVLGILTDPLAGSMTWGGGGWKSISPQQRPPHSIWQTEGKPGKPSQINMDTPKAAPEKEIPEMICLVPRSFGCGSKTNGIPFWLVGEFTTHVTGSLPICSDTIESDVHWGLTDLAFDPW